MLARDCVLIPKKKDYTVTHNNKLTCTQITATKEAKKLLRQTMENTPRWRYNLAVIWDEAGQVTFQMTRSPLPGASIFHINPLSQQFPVSFYF